MFRPASNPLDPGKFQPTDIHHHHVESRSLRFFSAGVDLALDKFDLSAPERFNQLPACSRGSQNWDSGIVRLDVPWEVRING